ncbi:putative phage tail protein [Clostridium botulinum]|uniref:putative phage tail protein n=1 Tax=Clostridium botulinum TaxID=1491 RepID=UPI000773B3F4|nr:putative phage tail protein [Clostridium botulinum]
MDSLTLLNHMPTYYLTSDLTKNITTAIANELNRYLEDCRNTQNELLIHTAKKTLDKYELDVVLPVSNNYEATYRISKIISKLRGQGIITIDRIKDIAEAYSNGEVEVSKKPSEYTLIITFTGTKGIPPNISDLESILNSLKAADWIIEYKFTYTTFAEMKKYTHADLSNYTHEKIRNELGGVNS